MTEVDLAYTAGIIDGEGNVGIYANVSVCHGGNRKPYRNSMWKMRVRVNNTDEWLIHWLLASYGGSIGRVDRGPKYSRNWKPSWWWSLSDKKALCFLELVIPYLRLKKPQAEIAIRFQSRKSTTGKQGKKLTETEQALAEADRILIQSMNKRGL